MVSFSVKGASELGGWTEWWVGRYLAPDPYCPHKVAIESGGRGCIPSEVGKDQGKNQYPKFLTREI